MQQRKEVRLFRNNRSQAVRIPVEFELPGETVFISRDGDRGQSRRPQEHFLRRHISTPSW
ncbi:antitoxin [Azospirillum oryzae]|uniref:antitoxin n=1 Tax=Azospirillum oryzae TaxID=286727 RepID=UPI001ABF355F|nr:AbrB/MazE/SpoVT family DNA-binding domain-containing protein [Azospirillum oryzae]